MRRAVEVLSSIHNNAVSKTVVMYYHSKGCIAHMLAPLASPQKFEMELIVGMFWTIINLLQVKKKCLAFVVLRQIGVVFFYNTSAGPVQEVIRL